jgi:acyl-coenzyme A synthetase/AMP-(fatty) acid ligase
VEELPRNPSGKILRREIDRDALAALLKPDPRETHA